MPVDALLVSYSRNSSASRSHDALTRDNSRIEQRNLDESKVKPVT